MEEMPLWKIEYRMFRPHTVIAKIPGLFIKLNTVIQKKRNKSGKCSVLQSLNRYMNYIRNPVSGLAGSRWLPTLIGWLVC